MPFYHVLNLDEFYLPSWGAWEVAREIVCNAIDADPKGMRIEYDGQDRMLVSTTTAPESMASMFVIGCGTKRPGSSIGQFGEGLKMAALVATRERLGGMTIYYGGTAYLFEFTADAVPGANVLAVREDPEAGLPPDVDPDRFTVEILLTGIANEVGDRINPTMAEGPFKKAGPEGVRIFCKGVYLATVGSISAYDWNLRGITTNRDRGIVDSWRVSYLAAAWLANNATGLATDVLQSLLDDTGLVVQSLEYQDTYNLGQRLSQVAAALHPGSLMESHPVANYAAIQKGRTMFKAQSDVVAKILASACLIETTAGWLSRDFEHVGCDQTQYAGQIQQLRTLDKLVAAPPFGVRVFESHDETLRGVARLEDSEVWLNASLFLPGNLHELARTYLHEAAHIMSGAGDHTAEFESAMDHIMGALAVRLLGSGEGAECQNS